MISPRLHLVLRRRQLLHRNPNQYAAISSDAAVSLLAMPQSEIIGRNLIQGRGAVRYFTATPNALPRSHPALRRRRHLIHRNPRYYTAISSRIAASQTAAPRSQILCRGSISCCGATRCFTATSDALPQSQMKLRCRQIIRRDLISCCGVSVVCAAIQAALPQPGRDRREITLKYGPPAC